MDLDVAVVHYFSLIDIGRSEHAARIRASNLLGDGLRGLLPGGNPDLDPVFIEIPGLAMIPDLHSERDDDGIRSRAELARPRPACDVRGSRRRGRSRLSIAAHLAVGERRRIAAVFDVAAAGQAVEVFRLELSALGLPVPVPLNVGELEEVADASARRADLAAVRTAGDPTPSWIAALTSRIRGRVSLVVDHGRLVDEARRRDARSRGRRLRADRDGTLATRSEVPEIAVQHLGADRARHRTGRRRATLP